MVHHEGSGLLVKGHDPADHARAIDRILSDRDLAQKLSEGGIFKSREFSWPKTVDRLLELYSGVSGL